MMTSFFSVMNVCFSHQRWNVCLLFMNYQHADISSRKRERISFDHLSDHHLNTDPPEREVCCAVVLYFISREMRGINFISPCRITRVIEVVVICKSIN